MNIVYCRIILRGNAGFNGIKKLPIKFLAFKNWPNNFGISDLIKNNL